MVLLLVLVDVLLGLDPDLPAKGVVVVLGHLRGVNHVRDAAHFHLGQTHVVLG